MASTRSLDTPSTASGSPSVAEAWDSPDRYERLLDETGRVYYLDHLLKISSWSIPERLPTNPLRRQVKYVREQAAAAQPRSPSLHLPTFCDLVVDRSSLLQSCCLAVMQKSPAELRRPLRFHFMGEAGVDLGGLTNEAFALVSVEMARPELGLLRTSPVNLLHLCPESKLNDPHNVFTRFLGRWIGLAVLHGHRMSLEFAPFVWRLLTQGDHPISASVQDLEGVDDVLLGSMLWILNNDPKDLSLSFEYDHEQMGETRTVNLHPSEDRDVALTAENADLYVRAVTQFILLDSVTEQSDALLAGLGEMIDVADWENHTNYVGFHREHQTIRRFWAIVESFSQPQRLALLRFSTGLPRLPPGGFRYLQASGSSKLFTIAIDTRPSRFPEHRLPSSHTCFNELVLPPFRTAEGLLNGLLVSIQETHDFGDA